MIIDDYKSYITITKILKYIDDENEKELKKSLLNDNENSFDILNKNINKLQKTFHDVVDENYEEYFDSSLIYQMIKNNSYGKTQICDLINFICDKIIKENDTHSISLDFWRKALLFKIKVTIPSTENLFNDFGMVIFKLINILKEQRTINMNKTLITMKKFLQGMKGIEIERKEMFIALNTGAFKIDKTYELYSKARNKINYQGNNSYERIILVHREVMATLLNELCKNNSTSKINFTNLPEFMVLDNLRLVCMRNLIRKLGIIISIWMIIQNWYTQIIKKEFLI